MAAASSASPARRKPRIRSAIGSLLSLSIVLLFWIEVNVVENLEVSNRKGNSIHIPPPERPLPKRTSKHLKKPPPPIYSSEHFENCKLLRPNDTIYEYGPWDRAPIVIESHKLVFFTIPKVGSTVLKQLFRRMEGYADYLDNTHPLPHAPKRNGLRYLYDFPPRQADFIMTSPEYTRAIFLRDPKERLLSAYLDKGRQGKYLQFHCCETRNSTLNNELDCAHPREHYGPAVSQADMEAPLLSFKDFVSLLVPLCDDPHWRPQASRLDAKYWKYINFVGCMESIESDTKRLLQTIFAWDEFGASGWPNGHIFAGSATVNHKTDSSKRLNEYFTPFIEELAAPILKQDYDLPLWQNITVKTKP